MFRVLVATSALVSQPGRAQTLEEAPTPEIETITVTGTTDASHAAVSQGIEVYDSAYVESTGAITVEEIVGTLPNSGDGGTPLILIDGRPTYLDPDSLPAGMIASIEVSRDGSMRQYGEFHDGPIINIRLKRNHATHELASKFTGASDGGGFRRNARAAGANNRESLRTIYSVEYTDNQPLPATLREFSRNQDRRASGGRDLRLPWGDTAVVLATEGSLRGLMDDEGNATAIALVPRGQDGSSLSPGDFLAPEDFDGPGPSGLLRFDTAPYRWLIAPGERLTFNIGTTYTVNDHLRIALEGSHRNSRGERLGPPPVTVPSADSVVPAAFNPFGQDVSIGLVHEPFGATRQRNETRRDQLGLVLDGKLAGGYTWAASAGARRDFSARVGAELDSAKLRSALAEPDPARRFNPFADTGLFDPNADLYPSLTSVRTYRSLSERIEAEISVGGSPFMLPGGPASIEFQGEWQELSRERRSTRVLGEAPELHRFAQTRREWSASLQLPFIGADNGRFLAERLDMQIAVELEDTSDSAHEFEWEAGLAWKPRQSWLLRAKFQLETTRPPGLRLAESDTLIDEILFDPLRDGEAITGVQVFSRGQIAARTHRRTRYTMGAVFNPAAFPSVEWQLAYRSRNESGIFKESFEARDVVDNASTSAHRIHRLEPSDADRAAGHPGRIVAIDLTPGSAGRADRREVELAFDYQPSATKFGEWRVTARLWQTLFARHESTPGVPHVTDSAGEYRRPRRKFDARVTFKRGFWSGAARVRHADSIPALGNAFNWIGASSSVDLNVTRRWRFTGSGDDRRELKLLGGVENLLGSDPPRADHVDGFRGGSPLGRAYSAAVVMEL